MQLTIDVDKHFIENLKQEFHTQNIKDALYQLLDFYKQSNAVEDISTDDKDYGFIKDARRRRENGEKTYNVDDEINQRVQDYKNGSLKIQDFHDGLEEIRNTILSKI